MAEPTIRDLIGELDASELPQFINELSDEEAEEILYDFYGIWAREKQIPPSWQWGIWVVLAGRGFGKTRVGAEWIIDGEKNHGVRRMALIGATAADVRDTMVLGESGIIECSPPSNRPHYIASRRSVVWASGATAWLYSAEKPRQLRGPQHERAWCDELAAWQYIDATLDMLTFGMRLGTQPQIVITTTPRPFKRIINMIAESEKLVTRVALTVGSMLENEQNLPPEFVAAVLDQYEGTTLGDQEIHAKIILDNDSALWKRDTIDTFRVDQDDVPELDEVVVSIDHAVSSGESSNDTAIVCLGRHDNHVYVLETRILHGDPLEWANAGIGMFHRRKADWLIVEPNNGGDLVTSNIHTVDENIPIKEIRATRGKAIRAAPVANIYQQGRAHHVGHHGVLEDQLTNWQPGQKSPDALDAMVAGATYLLDLNAGSQVPMHDAPIDEEIPMPVTMAALMEQDPFKWAEDHLGGDW